MMFMDRSKYEDQATPASSQFYKSDNQSVIGTYSSQFSQYELENVDTPRHICPVCDKTFRASSLLDIHMRVHVGAKPFVCPVCNHRATQKGNLKLHMKKHHGQDLPSHIDLTPDSGIWGNFSTSDNSDEMDLNCQLSNKKKTALAHSSLLNEDVVELIKKCQNNIGQSTMGRITESLKDFLDIAQQKLKSGSLPLKNELQKEEISYENLNSNNNRIKPGICELEKDTLPLISVSSQNCSLPMKSNVQENSLSKQFCYCKICGWKTTSSGYLNVHMRKHKAESHICTICGRAFKETWYLKNHMRSHANDVVTDPALRFGESSVARENAELKSSFQDEELIHKESNEKADCTMCSKCGFIFSKQFLPTHTETCKKEKNIKDTEMCESLYSKSAFMKTLQLTNEIPRKENELIHNMKHFDAMISNAVVYSFDADNQEVKPPEDSKAQPPNDPLHSLKREIENSIVQNGIEATKTSFQELIKNPNFKILLSSAHLQSIAELFNSEKPVPKSDNSAKHFTLMKGKMKLSPANKPYKHSAMQSLAIIGKSLEVDKASSTDHIVNNSVGVQQIQGYKCDYCSKWFKYKSVLSIHMRSHTGERPYKCAYCDYAGTQHNCLKVHLQRHHPEIYEAQNEDRMAKAKSVELKEVTEQEELFVSQGNRFSPARCPICDRVSPSPGYLKIHMRSHKTTLDHVCHICGRGFKEYWYLSTHLRTHDSEMNTSFDPVEEFRHFETTLDLPAVNARMQSGPSRKAHLTKQQSVPFDTCDINHLGHSYLSGTSSWSPLDRHEEFNGSDHSIHPRPPDVNPEPSRTHVSKRKAFQPFRHRPEPYTAHEPMRCRKSKPRKLSHGLYLAPTFQTLPYTSTDNACREDVEPAESLTTLNAHADSEQPLDLTVPIAPMATKEEPLNLAIK